MSRAKLQYHGNSTKEDFEGVDGIEEGPADTEPVGHWRPPYTLLATIGLLIAIAFFGGGFGVGWAVKPEKASSATAVVIPDQTNADSLNVNILRTYVPISYTAGLSNEQQALYDAQVAVLKPAFHVLTLLVSSLAGSNATYDPNVLRLYVETKYQGGQDTLAKVFNVAQRLQISPDFFDDLYAITTGLVDVFTYIRSNIVQLSAGGRRLLAASSDQPLAVDLAKAFIRSGLQAPELQGALGNLTPLWPVLDDLVDLVYDLYDSIRGIAAQVDDIASSQEAYHSSIESAPPPASANITLAGNVSINVLINSYSAMVRVSTVDDTAAEDDTTAAATTGGSRRMLRGDGGAGAAARRSLLLEPLPAGFTPSGPGGLPPVLIPTVWHITMFQYANGTYGPTGIESACDMVTRIVAIANYRLAPTNFQLYVKECRNKPSYQYLVRASQDAWLACTSTCWIYENCGDMIPDSAVDFPRTVNIYVAGFDAPCSGYSWAPGYTDDPVYGHIGFPWSTISTGGMNNRISFEGGSFALVHEVSHHLGLQHTYSSGDCNDADGSSVTDTPSASNPVWQQSWSTKAAIACMNYWNKTLSGNWDTANRQAAARVGIPAADVNPSFDSCPSSSGSDELGNYVTYSYDVCLLGLGHFTSGQIAAMHTVTSQVNPDLYQWGQYYAKYPPAGAVPSPPPPSPPSPSPPPPPKVGSPPPSPPPPPPPSPSPPPPPAATPTPSPSPAIAAACLSTTTRGCTCQASWTYNGVTYSDCVTVTDFAAKPFCSVDRTNGNCANARNGWWDYCTKSTACSTPPPPPPPSPPPPSPSPPPAAGTATPSCGAGAPTKSGLTCSSNAWKVTGSSTIYKGCANPNSNPNGVWCALASGQATASGAAWDYCLDACNATPPPPAAVPKITYPYAKNCANGVTGLPNTCTCQASYSIFFTAYGTSYGSQRGCTAFNETGGTGMCVVTCTSNKKSNNQAFACDCA